jgi:nitrite reductase/ring-hydroxylating ferredoxin subunit
MFDIFIATQNIERFRNLIALEKDLERSGVLKEMLVREEDKLSAFRQVCPHFPGRPDGGRPD